MEAVIPMYDDDDELIKHDYTTLEAYLRELSDYACDGSLEVCLEGAAGRAAELEKELAHAQQEMDCCADLLKEDYFENWEVAYERLYLHSHHLVAVQTRAEIEEATNEQGD